MEQEILEHTIIRTTDFTLEERDTKNNIRFF
jgi:hypothetical protein